MRSARNPNVVIVGAGPVGALSAVLLAARGVPVTLIEKSPGLVTASQASTFHPPTLDLLASIGIDLAADPDAVRVNAVQWRDHRGAILAEIDYTVLEGSTGHPFRVHLDQQALLNRLAERIAREPLIDFRTGITAESLDPARAEVTTSDPAGRRLTLPADLVVGCDGAHSAIREFAGITFPTAAYPTGAIRAFVSGSLDGLMPSGTPALSELCYFRGGGDGVSVLRMNTDTRLVVRTNDQPDSAARVRQALAAATPLKIGDLDITRIDSYRLQRGVADSYLSDRGPVLILGDAAHVTSTAGGLNMNSGIHDAFALMPAVADWLAGRTGRESLSGVASARRDYLVRQVIPRSERRVRGLQDGGRDSYTDHLADIASLATDTAAARRFMMEASLLDTPLTPERTP